MDGVTVVASRHRGLPSLMGRYSTSFTQPAAKYLHKTSTARFGSAVVLMCGQTVITGNSNK